MKAIRSQTIEEVMLILEEAKIEQPWKNLVNDKLETNTNKQVSPILLASIIGNPKIVSCLLENGAFINDDDFVGMRPLHLAAYHGHHESLNLILQHPDISIRSTSNDGSTAIHSAVLGKYSSESTRIYVMQLLLSQGADINAADADKSTPLHLACMRGLKESIYFLVSNGADINIKDADGNTPLHLICSMSTKDSTDQLAIVNFLIDKNADIHAKNKTGWMPIHKCVYEHHVALACMFVSKIGVSVYERTHYGMNALDMCCSKTEKGIFCFILY